MKPCVYVTNTTMPLFHVVTIEIDSLHPSVHDYIRILFDCSHFTTTTTVCIICIELLSG